MICIYTYIYIYDMYVYIYTYVCVYLYVHIEYICIDHIYIYTYMQHLDVVPVKNVDFRCHVLLSEGILAPLFVLAPSQWVASLELPETETGFRI